MNVSDLRYTLVMQTLQAGSVSWDYPEDTIRFLKVLEEYITDPTVPEASVQLLPEGDVL